MKNRISIPWLLCIVACAVLVSSAVPACAQTDATAAIQTDVAESSENAQAEDSDADKSAESPVQDNAVPETDSVPGEGLRLNFRGAPLDAVLDYLSKEAGFVIIRDTEITGRVDVWSYQPLNKEEAIDLLDTILNTKGYAAIRNGRMLTIVSRDEAKTRDIPVRKGSDPAEIRKTDEMVIQIIPVRYADAVQLVENIRPLLPSYATVTANQSGNAIILTDTQTNIRRMAEIVQALDTSISEVSSVKVFTLEQADATEVATMINNLFQTQNTGGSRISDRQQRMQEFMSRMGGVGGMPGGMRGRGRRGGE